MSDGKGRKKDQNFNPRSPHGERPTDGDAQAPPRKISIHAPRTGSDRNQRTRERKTKDFNPRSPHGERRFILFHPRLPEPFQSTLPARGATFYSFPSASSRTISIHAPRTGSDMARHGKMAKQGISIHAPRTGSDALATSFLSAGTISIHAPRTGSDIPLSTASLVQSTFQSTLPARGATKSSTR